MDKSLPKTMLVTGCSGGIGSHIVDALLSNNYQVIGVDIKQRHADLNPAFDFIQLDLSELVSKPATHRKFLDSLASLKSFHNLAGLVNCAAVQYLANTREIHLEKFRLSLEVNVLAAFELSRICYDMLKANRGSILNISSIHSHLSKPDFISYAVSKSALSAMTRSLALAWGADIRVNAIEPAAVLTDMLLEGFSNDRDVLTKLQSLHPSQEIGDPKNLAKHILYLLDNPDPQLNGCIMNIDGGISGALTDL